MLIRIKLWTYAKLEKLSMMKVLKLTSLYKFLSWFKTALLNVIAKTIINLTVTVTEESEIYESRIKLLCYRCHMILKLIIVIFFRTSISLSWRSNLDRLCNRGILQDVIKILLNLFFAYVLSRSFPIGLSHNYSLE